MIVVWFLAFVVLVVNRYLYDMGWPWLDRIVINMLGGMGLVWIGLIWAICQENEAGRGELEVEGT